MIYDASDKKPGVELADAWAAGGWLYRGLRRLDDCRGFLTWTEALEWLAGLGSVDEVQYWGHGSPGCVWLGGEALDVRALSTLRVTSLFWLRTCASFAGIPGQRLAKAMSSELGCRVAGHTFNIGPLQSGLHSLRPGLDPEWPETEGLAEGLAEKPLAMRSSVPWAPNTITCLHGTVPERW
jgi:hypothetical protein